MMNGSLTSCGRRAVSASPVQSFKKKNNHLSLILFLVCENCSYLKSGESHFFFVCVCVSPHLQLSP